MTIEELNAIKKKVNGIIANGEGIDDKLGLMADVDRVIAEYKQLQAFYNYFSKLYGQGLEIANWHQNGDLELFDNFFESAEESLNS